MNTSTLPIPIHPGWNLGNTFDAHTDEPYSPDTDIAVITRFGNPLPDRNLFEMVKRAGFASVRIPVSFHNHLTDRDFTISEAFLRVIKNAVDTALEIGFTVIINIHHDNSPEYIYPDSAHLESSWVFMKSIWNRLSEVFADYDERLVFEAMNEPRLVGTEFEWIHVTADNPVLMDALHTIVELNSRFTALIRQNGIDKESRNRDRFLMLPSYAAAPENSLRPEFTLPGKPYDTHLILSVHAYTPYNFALAPAETAVTGFDDTDPTDTAPIDRFMDKLYEKFPDTPIVIGEFGATNRKNPADRERFARYYTKKARSYGFHCIWWDNGSIYRERGEHFGLFDRRKNTVKFPEIVKALTNE